MTPPGPRKIKSRTGLESNFAAALAYALGPIGGIVFLLIEKDDDFVRFHALQSIVTFTGIAVLHLVLRNLPLLAWMAAGPVLILSVVVWIVLMFKALSRERYKVPVLGDFVERQLAPRAR
jgi:uncharacterized membrane protein